MSRVVNFGAQISEELTSHMRDGCEKSRTQQNVDLSLGNHAHVVLLQIHKYLLIIDYKYQIKFLKSHSSITEQSASHKHLLRNTCFRAPETGGPGSRETVGNSSYKVLSHIIKINVFRKIFN